MDLTVLKPPAKTSGPMPKFVFEDVLRAFWLVGSKKLAGRKELADSLDLGEGTMRSVSSFLQARGFLKKIQGGCMLSEKGERVFEKLKAQLISARQMPPLYSTLERPSFCLQCSISVDFSVPNSVEARDAAVKAGSEGLVSLVFKRKNFFFLGTRDSVVPKDAKAIVSTFNALEKSVFLLSFARKPLDRERGAWAAFIALQKNSRSRSVGGV